MGEWAFVKGTHNSKKVSMKKLAALVIQDDELLFGRQDNGQEFEFRFPNSGLYAAKKLEAITEEFKALDKNARLHMEATIDFYV
jgi:hypothetical protein